MPKCIGKVEVHFLWTNFEAKRTLICGQREEYACHYDQPKKKYQNLKYVINITYSVAYSIDRWTERGMRGRWAGRAAP